MDPMEQSHFDVLEISISVWDLEKAVQEFKDRLGIEPYYQMEYEMPEGIMKMDDEVVPTYLTKMAFYHAGPVRIELLEADGGPFHEFIKKHGPGVNHIGCRVSDRDYEMEWFKKREMQIKATIDVPGGKWAYLDTEPLIGCYLELIETNLREPGIPR